MHEPCEPGGGGREQNRESNQRRPAVDRISGHRNSASTRRRPARERPVLSCRGHDRKPPTQSSGVKPAAAIPPTVGTNSPYKKSAPIPPGTKLLFPAGILSPAGHSGGTTRWDGSSPRSRTCPVPALRVSNSCSLLGFGGTHSAIVNLSHGPRVGSPAGGRPHAGPALSTVRTNRRGVPAF